MKRWLYLGIVVVLGALFWWGLKRDPGALKSVLINKPAPDFELPLLPPYREQWGERFRFSDHIGQPILVNFWASWCYPACYEEAPILQAAWEKFQGKVLFVGVDTQDQEDKAQKFIDMFGITYPQVFDPRGQVGIDYGTYGVPESFFIDAKGIIRSRFAGAISAEELEKRLLEVMR